MRIFSLHLTKLSLCLVILDWFLLAIPGPWKWFVHRRGLIESVVTEIFALSFPESAESRPWKPFPCMDTTMATPQKEVFSA
jgi:hypothetical protein